MKTKIFLIIGLFFIIFGLMQGVSKAAIPTAQRDALIAFYNSTDGDNWDSSSGVSDWKALPVGIDDFSMPGTECGWYGVTCDSSEEYVTRLQLESNNLDGTISSSLSGLIELRVLDLSGNFLTEPIPDLSSLDVLWRIDLGENLIGGNIPTHLSGVTDLQDLILSNNALDGAITIPETSGDLPNLRTLDLRNNQLDGAIPSNITYLTALTYLHVEGNQLIGAFPSGFDNLTLVPNGSDFRYNALYAADTTMRDYVDDKQLAGTEWENTQTIAPDNFSAGSETDDSITLTWTPIAYQAGGGGYDIDYRASGGGWNDIPETNGRTADKSISTYTISSLEKGTNYSFRVRTITLSRTGYNDNDVYSEYATTSATTTGEEEGEGCFINSTTLKVFNIFK